MVTSDLYGTLFDKAGQEMAEKAAGLSAPAASDSLRTMIPDSSPTTRPETEKSGYADCARQAALRGLSGWPGTGSNRRPSDFQSDARTN